MWPQRVWSRPCSRSSTWPGPGPAAGRGRPRARLLVVTEAKDGEGASTVAVNLAGGLARRGFHVVLVDGDPVFGDLALMLGLPNDVAGLVTHQETGIRLLVAPGSQDPFGPREDQGLADDLATITLGSAGGSPVDVVIVDSAGPHRAPHRSDRPGRSGARGVLRPTPERQERPPAHRRAAARAPGGGAQPGRAHRAARGRVHEPHRRRGAGHDPQHRRAPPRPLRRGPRRAPRPLGRRPGPRSAHRSARAPGAGDRRRGPPPRRDAPRGRARRPRMHLRSRAASGRNPSPTCLRRRHLLPRRRHPTTRR